MDSSRMSAILIICMLFISSVTPILGCGSCGHHGGKKPHGKPIKPVTKPGKGGPVTLPPIISKPPVTLPHLPPVPPVVTPPVTLPPVKPPIDLPPVVKPPIDVPPVKPPIDLPPAVKPPIELPPVKPPIDLPPVVKPPIDLPPVKPPIDLPPVGIPPVLPKPTTPSAKPCPPPSGSSGETCPIDILKLGACVDLLGGLVHVGLGDQVVNKCCPVLQGLVELEAAVCLCTTLKVKLLNLNVLVPLALQLLVTCGKTPPPGFNCAL